MQQYIALTKSKVYNISQSCQRKTEPWPKVTCTENFVKFGCVVFEICEWTDKQINKQTCWLQHFASLPAKKSAKY